MFGNIINFFKRFGKNEKEKSKSTAKERLHLVLAQDRAHISADFLEMMKQEIIEVIKKYVDIDEDAIDVRMTNKPGEDGIVGAPALYANIPIVTIKNEARKLEGTVNKKSENASENNTEEQINEEKEETKDIGDEKLEEEIKEQKQDESENENEEEKEVQVEKEQEEADNDNKEDERQENSDPEDTKKENIKEDVNEKKNS